MAPVSPNIIRVVQGALPNNQAVPLLPGWYWHIRYPPIDILLGYHWYQDWTRGSSWGRTTQPARQPLAINDVTYASLRYFTELPRPVSQWRSSMTTLREVGEALILPADTAWIGETPASTRWRLQYTWNRVRIPTTESWPGRITQVPPPTAFMRCRLPRRLLEGCWTYIDPYNYSTTLLRPLWDGRYVHHIPDSWR